MKTHLKALTKKSAEIVPLHLVKKKRRLSEDKWSPEVMKLGYTQLPNLLFEAQGRLKITPVQFNVLLQVIQHWWDADEWPFPAKDLIARRLNKSPRQVQRYLTALEKKKLITRIPRFKGKNSQTSNGFSLDGLVKKLKAVEPEFTQARAQKKLRNNWLRKKVETAVAS